MVRTPYPVRSVRALGAARPAGTPLMRPPGGGDLAGQVLGELGRLVERGVLTPEEFAVVKARLLAG